MVHFLVVYVAVPFTLYGNNDRITLYSGDTLGKTNSAPEIKADRLVIDFIAIYK